MAESNGDDNDPMNINSKKFDSENYVNSLILKKGLDELVTVEGIFKELILLNLWF